MPENELAIGSFAPDFKLMSNNGSEVALTDYRGNKTILFFVREYN